MAADRRGEAEGTGATTIVEAIRTDAYGVELDPYPASPTGLADVGYGGRFDLAPAGADRYSALTALTSSARPAFASAKSMPVFGFT